ncbi:DegV family protein [Murdochiella sp. Marseille-P8839]|nr:DegV family protein [Murdochiella sp. Marseille-P8839]
MAIRIIIDSASDYTKEEAEREGLLFVPMGVSFGNTAYLDGVDLTKDDFYDLLVDQGGMPVSSQPSPQHLMEAFQTVVDAGDYGILLTMGSSLSGTYQTAKMIAEDYDGKIAVIDSETISVAERLLVRTAKQIAEEARTLEEAVETIQEKIRHLYLFGYMDQLEYLKRGGRISPAMNFMANLFSVKAIIYIYNNTFELYKRARGKQKGWMELANILREKEDIQRDSVIYGYTGYTDRYPKEFMRQYPDLAVPEERVFRIGSTIGTHAGPGALAVAFFADPDTALGH